MIPVTKPFQPPIEILNKHLKDIWDMGIYTNNGPKVLKLETKLKKYLNVRDLLFLTNGTIALQLSLKALALKGEVITTPFSYIATASSIKWEGCTPVFVDIDQETYNIDPNKIESKITSKTSAILATHVFGNPCAIDEIDVIAKKHKLKVIYDGAHAFGVKYKGVSIFNFGDITTCSTHATKIFHTIEGGFVVSKEKKLIEKIKLMRNFGHDGPYNFTEIGINGKNSELHASVGLTNIIFINDVIDKRKSIFDIYHNRINNKKISFQKWNNYSYNNYSYFPVLINNPQNLEKCISLLQKSNIYPRRYFFPSLSNLEIFNPDKIKDANKISENVASRILCLPIYFDLSIEDAIKIADIINSI